MPRMDGYEVIRNLRKNPAHKSTPILVLTTESEAEKKNLAREAGATELQNAGLSKDAAKDQVKSLFQGIAKAATTAGSAAAPPRSPTSARRCSE